MAPPVGGDDGQLPPMDPNLISRGAYNMTKTMDATSTAAANLAASEVKASERADRLVKIKEENLRQKDLEAEVMGTVKKGVTSQSDIKERNLSQMISVLHMRLPSLEKRQAERMDLVKEDVRTDSTRCSSDIKTRGDDIEDLGLLKGDGGGNVNKATKSHRDNNLVSHTDGVQLDPIHLVLKTKQSTEAARRLEVNLEDAFGTANTRDFRGQKKGGGGKGKGGGSGGNQRENEQQKYDRKKQQRIKLEKQLQTNMESFVTRSILDPELDFAAPLLPSDGVEWPISMKWNKKDPRSQTPENAEGEMDPVLMLRYALERINLPAHEQLFRWLAAQLALQNYFVHLFWLIKVKFFQNETDPEHERFLMGELANFYAVIISLLAERTHAEHEKDHVYKYLPYVLCTAVYYGFHFLCPGSRHLYTKGFRKTILMQIVQMMNGVQLCPVSVKVSWARLFPEEAHEEEEAEAEGGSESIPVQIALTQGKALAESLKPPVDTSNLLSFGPTIEDTSAKGQTKSGKLASDDADADDNTRKSSRAGGDTARSAPSHADSRGARTAGTTGTTGGSRPGTADSAASFSANVTGLKTTVDPFERTFLTAPAERPGRYFVIKRQNVTTMNALDVSPLMQSLLGWDTASGEKQQQIFRTVPVAWCPAGGSETYKRRNVPKELHDSISARISKSEREFRVESALGQRRKIATNKLVEKKCALTMSSGQARISQYALDLMKAQRAKERGGKASKQDDEIEEEIDPAAANLTGDFDGDFDEFLAEFD